MNGYRFRLAGMAAILTAMVVGLGAGVAPAQPLRPGLSSRQATAAGQETQLTAATTRNPERVRTMLMAIHGFTQAQLDAVSTDVAAILREFIADPAESNLIHRQAVKGLRFYPSEENFTFISGELETAPPGLQVLYLLSLGAFAENREQEIVPLVNAALESDRVTVRHAAVTLAGRLPAGSGVSLGLEARLAVEPDPAVQRAIRGQLQAN